RLIGAASLRRPESTGGTIRYQPTRASAAAWRSARGVSRLVIFFPFPALIGGLTRSDRGAKTEAIHDRYDLENVGSWVCCWRANCRIPSRAIIRIPSCRYLTASEAALKAECEKAFDATPDASKNRADIESKWVGDLPTIAAHRGEFPSCVRYVRALLNDP